jgi:hypothetical protein
VSPENILVPRCIHRLIIDVQPSFTTTVATAPCIAITVRVEYMERIVSTARRHTVVVEDTIERVSRGLSGSSGGRGHDIYTSRTTRYSQLRLREDLKKEKMRTEWDFELWRELDRFSDLDYATRGRVIEEALEMKNEHGRERLDQHLLARFARV